MRNLSLMAQDFISSRVSGFQTSFSNRIMGNALRRRVHLSVCKGFQRLILLNFKLIIFMKMEATFNDFEFYR